MVFGDLHYDDVPDGDRRIAELLAHAEETKPDFIISLGDLCYPAEKNKAVLEKLCSAGIPLYHTIGNHDTENCHLKNTLKFLSMKNPFYSFEYDDVKFIVLNSSYLAGTARKSHILAETTKRTARYTLLFRLMKRNGLKTS